MRQQLIDEEARVVAADRVVLEAAIHPIERVARQRLHAAVHHEDADERRNRLLRDQVVEHRRRVVLQPVLKHHHRRRLRAIELLGHVDPVLAPRAGIHPAVGEFALRHVWIRRRGIRRRLRWEGGRRLP
jgi:hypothetical protein